MVSAELRAVPLTYNDAAGARVCVSAGVRVKTVTGVLVRPSAEARELETQ